MESDCARAPARPDDDHNAVITDGHIIKIPNQKGKGMHAPHSDSWRPSQAAPFALSLTLTHSVQFPKVEKTEENIGARYMNDNESAPSNAAGQRIELDDRQMTILSLF